MTDKPRELEPGQLAFETYWRGAGQHWHWRDAATRREQWAAAEAACIARGRELERAEQDVAETRGGTLKLDLPTRKKLAGPFPVVISRFAARVAARRERAAMMRVADALPTDAADERIVDELMTKREVGLTTARAGRRHVEELEARVRELEAELAAAEPFRAWVREHGRLVLGAIEYAGNAAGADCVSDASCHAAHDELRALLDKGE